VAGVLGGPAADFGGEVDGGGQAGGGPADRGLAKVAAQPLNGGGQGRQVAGGGAVERAANRAAGSVATTAFSSAVSSSMPLPTPVRRIVLR